MDIGDNGGDVGFGTEPQWPKVELPDDLPRSLDDRRPAQYTAETEMYDAWQGKNCDLLLLSRASSLTRYHFRPIPVSHGTCACETTPVQQLIPGYE